MAVSNAFSLSVDPFRQIPNLQRPTFSYNVYSAIVSFNCLYSPSHKQDNLRRTKVEDLPGHSPLKLFTRRPKPSRTLCQVKSEDSGESILLDQQTLERDLQIAIQEENYAQAAKLRDSLRILHDDSKASVLAANARFYNSFKNGDLAAMQALWTKGDNACVVHPGVSGICGYDLVMGSWEFVWADYEFPLEIELRDVQAHVKGDVGYVTCVELVKTKGSSWGRHFATNVFERIDGQWFICIHHASHVDL